MNASTALTLAALGLLAGSLLHIVVLIGGPDWIAFVGAPASIVQSARDGTWLAPVGALGIAGLLGAWALYALSAAGRFRPVPFTKPILWFVAVLFILRGVLVAPALIAGRVDWRNIDHLFVVGSSAFILAIGALLAAGLILQAPRRFKNT